MRLLKLLLVGIVVAVAVMAGLFAVAIIGLSALGIVAARRLRGRRHDAAPDLPAARRSEPAAATDVIDVTVTELPAEPRARLTN